VAISKMHDAQLKQGTFVEKFNNLRREFHELQKLNLDLSDFESAYAALLKKFEATRIKAEKEAMELRERIRDCEARAAMSGLYSQMLLDSLVGLRHLKEKQADQAKTEDPPPPPNGGQPAPESFCQSCGCTCDEDALDDPNDPCKCPCHKGKHCGHPDCVYCDERVKKNASPPSPDQ
jgi:hypothetical protein